MKKRVLALLLVLTMVSSLAACGKTGDTKSDSTEDYSKEIFGNNVITIDITADQDKWDDMIKNASSKPTISADVKINGETYKDVSIKTKGNTSLQQVASSDSDRYSLKINFGKNVEGQTCHGLDKLVLNNIYGDSTYMKEYMSYQLMQYMNVPSSLSTYAEITVNGEHYGFCLAIEDVDDNFLKRNYGEDFSGSAYKPESMEMGGDQGQNKQFNKNQKTSGSAVLTGDNDQLAGDPPQAGDQKNQGNPPNGGGRGGQMNGGSKGVNLVYSDDDPDSYSNIFDNAITKTDEEDEQRLIASLKAINEGKDLEKYIDVDEVLRYAAVNVFLVNLDSYFSNMGHNYCLAENNGKLSMLPWDYNLSFGTYQLSSASDAINYPIDTVFYNVDSAERPIISKLLENKEYQATYHKYLQQLSDYVSSGKFADKVDSVSADIDSYVKNDTTSFDGYDAFVTGVKALKTFATLRAESVAGQLDGSIPSTQEAQKDSTTLIDSGDLNLKDLGGMRNGGGGGGPQGGMNPTQDGMTPPNNRQQKENEKTNTSS